MQSVSQLSSSAFTEANSHSRCSVGICDILELRKAANGGVADLVCCLGPRAPQIQSLRCSAPPAAKDKALFSCFFGQPSHLSGIAKAGGRSADVW